MAPKRKAPARGRKRGGAAGGGGGAAKKPTKSFDLGADDHIDDDASVASEEEKVQEEEDEEVQETAAEKRVRLAKSYLKHVEEVMGAEESASDDDVEDRLGARLEKERLAATGTLRRAIAEKFKGVAIGDDCVRILGRHKLPVTCVDLTRDERTAYSASKDNSVVSWDVESGKKKAVLVPSWKGGCGYPAHKREVLAMAVSSDGRYLATGGRAKEIHVFDTRTNARVKTFSGHRDAVMALVFRTDSHALYSGSLDRCLKHWNCDELAYVETAFGHQAGIQGIDAFRKERAVTCGEDRTTRLWKLTEESHLMFKGHAASIDCVAMLSEESWLSGGQDGTLSLWQASKKKPAVVVQAAHGGPGQWISSVAALKMSDLAASGSSDGYVRLWQASTSALKSVPPVLAEVGRVALPGYVNGLKLGTSGGLMLAGCGKEHRLGRWNKIEAASNAVYAVKLPSRAVEEEEEDEEEEDESSGEEEDEDDEDEED